MPFLISFIGLATLSIIIGLRINWLIFLGLLGVGYISIHQTLKNSEDKDPGSIIFDELLGISFAILLFKLFTKSDSPFFAVLSALLFVGFDVSKPGPIGFVDQEFEKIKGLEATGVILDDLLAALPASIISAFLFSLRGVDH